MKKTIICNIPMKQVVEQTVYESDDVSVAVSDRAVKYPVNAYFEKNISEEDDVKIILLLKQDEFSNYEKNRREFEEEINKINSEIGANISITIINTEFLQKKVIHEQLMGMIVEEIEDGSKIIADITYGPKELPIIVFSVLGFAEKSLDCEIEAIIYGQANFVNGHVVNTKICDMSSLYYLSSVTNTINCNGADKARKALKSLLSI